VTHPLLDTVVSGRRVRVLATDRIDGDMHPIRVATDVLERRQVAASGRTWTMIDHVHGTDVVQAGDGTTGDVLVSTAEATHIAVWAADCAPLVLVSSDGTLVAAHGGWRGLAAGVVDIAIHAATQNGGVVAAAVLGPVIHPCCYEFGNADLQTVADGLGVDVDAVAAMTSKGKPALDVPSGISAALGRHGIDLDASGPCTGCDDRWFSHRARQDRGRHAVVVYRESA
jgi:copper oxidase (laccase) domain-containing protein